MKRLFVAMALIAGVQQVSAQAVIPGWLTDPTNVKGAAADVEEAYKTPEQFQYPYISTYYVKPTVIEGENVKISVYITDFNHSKVRFLDDSHRFTAYLEYRLKGGASKIVTLKDVKSGDSDFNLGALPMGEYEFRVWAKDRKNRESHRVIQDFRVVDKDFYRIPADKVYTMTKADLKAYGIRNDGDFEKIVYTLSNKTEVVKQKRAGVPGYTVTVPLDPKTGRVPYRAFEKASVVYDAGYDKEQVATNAYMTSIGIQKLLDDKAAAGYRKFVMLPGTYRVSHLAPICVPGDFTLELGKAVLKLNAFTGCSSLIIRFAGVDDAHIVGGTIEGDYWTHDYKSPKDSEWVSGFEIGGECWNCSVDGLKVVDITGYGGQNGISKNKRGGLAFHYEFLPKFAPGGLDPRTGLVDSADRYRFTTDFKELKKVLANNHPRMQISKYLGYQGVATRSWQMTVAWYDAEKKFISAETSWQYREMWIPKNAAFVRVSVEDASVEAANKSGLLITAFRMPINCAVRNCTFEHCRCVGYAASAMRNMIFEKNLFTRNGEAEAKCAFDAEDGADQMQDCYFLGNVFRGNPINNSILTCGGHNYTLEKNVGSIHFWGRTNSPCVRDNDVEQAEFWCDSRVRSGYARIENNRYSKGIRLGRNEIKNRPDNWDMVLSKQDYDGSKSKIKLEVGPAGRIVGCTLSNMDSVWIANAYACYFENCKGGFSKARWKEVTVKDSTFKGFYHTNTWDKCHFEKTVLQSLDHSHVRFNGCDFKDCELWSFNEPDSRMESCKFVSTSWEGGWNWEKPAKLYFKNCEIATRDNKPFLDPGIYAIGMIGFDGCTVTGKKPLINVKDLRPYKTDDPSKSPDNTPGKIALRNVKWASESKTVISHNRGENQSTKKLTIHNKTAKWPEGVTIAPDLFPGWEVK